MSAIYILWLRELKRYFRSRAQMIASLGQPLLYLLVLGFGMGPVFERAGQGSYLQFVAPGVIGMSVLFTSIFSGIGLLWDRQFGFLKETLVAPVPRLHIMIGRTLGGVLQMPVVVHEERRDNDEPEQEHRAVTRVISEQQRQTAQKHHDQRDGKKQRRHGHVQHRHQ